MKKLASYIYHLNIPIHLRGLSSETALWKLLSILQATFSIWLVHATQGWPSSTLLITVIWGGAVICIEDKLDELQLRPTPSSLIAGTTLLTYTTLRGVATLSSDAVVYALPFIQGLGLALLTRPIRQFQDFYRSLVVLSLFPLENVLDRIVFPEGVISGVTGQLTALILLIFGEQPSVLGRTVQIGNSAVSIGEVCSGIDLMAQLSTIALIFSLAFPLRNKMFVAIYIVLTPVFAVVINASRIVILSAVNSSSLASKDQIFDFFHSGLGSLVFAAIGIVVMGYVYMQMISKQLASND